MGPHDLLPLLCFVHISSSQAPFSSLFAVRTSKLLVGLQFLSDPVRFDPGLTMNLFERRNFFDFFVHKGTLRVRNTSTAKIKTPDSARSMRVLQVPDMGQNAWMWQNDTHNSIIQCIAQTVEIQHSSIADTKPTRMLGLSLGLN